MGFLLFRMSIVGYQVSMQKMSLREYLEQPAAATKEKISHAKSQRQQRSSPLPYHQGADSPVSTDSAP
jgi:hypothetical protein